MYNFGDEICGDSGSESGSGGDVMMMEMAVVSVDCLDAVERNVRPFMCEKQINIIIIEVELS